MKTLRISIIGAIVFSTPSFVENVMQPGGDFEEINKLVLTSQTETTEMKKLRSGFLLKEILDRSRRMQGFQPVEPPQLRLYFAHDTTIVDMLKSLGLFEVSITFCCLNNYQFFFFWNFN